jgi:DNA-binding IclR family transcriptional regulator
MQRQNLNRLGIKVMHFMLRNRNAGFSGLRIAKALKERQSSTYDTLNLLCELKYLNHKENKYQLSENFRNYKLDSVFLQTLWSLFNTINEELKYNVFDFTNFLLIYANEVKLLIR